MRKVVAFIALIAVLGGGAYYFLSVKVDQGVKQALDQAIQKLPPEWSVTYRSLDVAVANRQAIVKGVEIHRTGENKLDAAIDEIDVTGASLDVGDAWAKAVAAPASFAPDQALPVADGIALKGIRLQVDVQDVKIGSVTLAKLKLFPWALLHDGVPGFAEALNALKQPPAAEAKPEAIMLPLLHLEAASLLGIGLDSYAVDDFSATLTIPMPDETGPQTITYSVAKLSSTGLDRGKLASGTMDGLDIAAGPVFTAKIGHFDMAGFDLQAAMTRLLTANSIDPEMFDGARLGDFDYRNISITAPGKPPVDLGGVSFKNVGFGHGLPISTDFSVTDFKLTKAAATDATLINAFDQLHLDVVTVNFGGGYRWDVDKKMMILKDLTIKIDELGALGLSAELSGIEPGVQTAQTATLDHALLHYTDASLGRRAIDLAAAMSGSDGPKLRQKILLVLQAQGARPDTPPGVAAALKAVAAFVTDPHSLTIELAPPKPVALASLQALGALDPNRLLAAFGVIVTANQ